MPSSPSTSPVRPIRRLLAALCVAFAAAAAGVQAQAGANDLAAILARPMSPGSVALLVGHANQLAVQKRLIEAAKHDDPAVRAVAARVAFITKSKGVAPALITALPKEQHVHTAAEQVRALMAFYGQPGDAIVIGSVKRLGGPTMIAFAESLARNRPMDLVNHVPMFAAMPERELREVGGALATACAQHSSSAREIMVAVLATKNAKLWTAVLEAMHETGRAVPPEVLVQALKSSDEDQRTTTVWHLYAVHDDGDPIPEEVIAAASPQPVTTADSLTWEAFVRELFARQRGVAATKADWAGLLAAPAHKERVTGLTYDAYAYLTDAEMKAIGAARGDRQAGGIRRSARRGEWETLKAPEARTHNMRTIQVFAKGLLSDLMTIHGCRTSGRDLFAAGEVKYRPDGSAQSISVVQANLSRQCVAFVNAALTLTIASVDHPVAPDLVDRVIVLLDPAFLACADDPFAPSRPQGADLKFEWPALTRKPKVEYPASLMRAGMPDVVVVLRVGVSHTGCISSAETMRSVLPAFDLEAIQSMFGVKMTPATLGGQPVDTDITYAVRFSLRR